MKKIIFILITLFISTQVHAGVIYDESTDGDSPIWWSDGGANLGTVQDGDIALGHVTYTPLDWDGYTFNLDGTLDTITIEVLAGTVSNNWQLYLNDSVIYNEHLSFVGDLAIFDVTGFSGTYSVGNNGISPSDYDYSITFAGEGQVPAPAPLALMGLGLAALGYSRKRKA